MGRRSSSLPEADEVQLRFGGTTPVSYVVGGATVAVPGMLAGLETAHRRHGRLPWRELVLPAARLARSGGRLTAEQAYVHEVFDPILRLDEEGRGVYGGDGPLVEGDVLRFPQLADSLELIAEQGVDSYYRGELADLTLAYVAERGGLLTRADLASYRVLVRPPLSVRYRGGLLLTNPPPATGGILIAHTPSACSTASAGAPTTRARWSNACAPAPPCATTTSSWRYTARGSSGGCSPAPGWTATANRCWPR